MERGINPRAPAKQGSMSGCFLAQDQVRVIRWLRLQSCWIT